MSQAFAAIPALLFATTMPVEAEAAIENAAQDAPASFADADATADEGSAYSYSTASEGYATFASNWSTRSLPVSFRNVTSDFDGYAPLISRALDLGDSFSAEAATLSSYASAEPDGWHYSDGENNSSSGNIFGILMGFGILSLLSIPAWLYYLKEQRIRNAELNATPAISGGESTAVEKALAARAAYKASRAEGASGPRLDPRDATALVGMEKKPSVAPPRGPGYTYGRGGNH